MHLVDTAVDDPADHLALDEALLLQADDLPSPSQTIRLWQFSQPIVVLGRASKVDVEVDRRFCQSRQIPIMRRCSGGAAVVGGPGCLMYSIVLNLEANPELRRIDAAHRYVMQRVLRAIRQQLSDARLQGICDITWQNRKCSGNSVKYSRRNLLYHGTVLYDADLDLLARCLREPPRQPDYRHRREHNEFVTNIPVQHQQLYDDLIIAFDADQVASSPDLVDRVKQLRESRYDDPAWHFRH